MTITCTRCGSEYAAETGCPMGHSERLASGPSDATACSAFVALTRLQSRFRSLYKVAGERREEAEKRGDLDAMQENACERSAYLQAAMEVTNEIDLLNAEAMRGGADDTHDRTRGRLENPHGHSWMNVDVSARPDGNGGLQKGGSNE